ncbi:patatin-like phospholipase family protein [Agarivorans sp. B2Z047]|uniref:patatin-like phospholipase family protein n=1 Tax=Agarivorans sp. B2Z047 TaxID=2652721 RepID=UPI001D14E282|nr:patatin-like phospholipase family protein [Agarivorans sp. B2Z047]UQN42337.1 patatin-like phospholipase family protein [Agarivorans sp. B2Z047]
MSTLPLISIRSRFCLALLLFMVVGCSSPERNAAQESELMYPLATAGLRYWDGESTEITEHNIEQEYQSILDSRARNNGVGSDIYHLALSGGGVNGAFSAGVLNAWTANGDRPEFDLVTGVSTGAIVSVFAYLGSDYDSTLKNYYTETPMSSLFQVKSIWSLLRGEAVLDTAGFEDQVRSYIDADIVKQLAEQRAKGRLLVIGTTNLDNEKMSLWDVGKIAQVGSDEAITLIQNIIIASSSVPGAFPAKSIVIDDGQQRFEELHVDGGVSRQVFLVPQWAYYNLPFERNPQHVFVIRNGLLKPHYQVTNNNLTDIGLRSISTIIRNQGIGDVEHIYHFAQHNQMTFRLAYIDNDFSKISDEAFTKEYMTSLYQYGYQKTRADSLWENVPPSLQHVQ